MIFPYSHVHIPIHFISLLHTEMLVLVQQYKMQDYDNIKKFKQILSTSLTPYKCQHHTKPLTMVCIDQKCQNQGLICSLCLTVNGPHKNHDAADLIEYIENCFKQLSHSSTSDQANDLLARAETVFANLMSLLKAFVENFTNIVQVYVLQRTDLHRQRTIDINCDSYIKQLCQSKLQSLPQINKIIKSLSPKYCRTCPISASSKPRKAQDYVGDITYQIQHIGSSLRKLQVELKSVLSPKSTTPIVVHHQPTFESPKLLQSSEEIYLGECKENQPHGLGMCYYPKAEKFIYGQFYNGKADGLAQMYYDCGDFYVGQFRGGRKEGRGVNRWLSQEFQLYEGEFKGGRRHGRGVFWWADGSKYQGNFVHGNQEGFGVLYRGINDKQYEGYWLKGEFHGKGIQYFPNGEYFQGEFKEDKFHGSGTLHKQTTRIEGKWHQNQLIQITQPQPESE